MKLELLKEWERNIKASDEVLNRLYEFFGYCTGPIEKSISSLQRDYTDAISKLVGDTEDSLWWYWTDNDMGANGYEAGFYGDPKPITSIEQLLELIEATKND